jgi:hypothetical protein
MWHSPLFPDFGLELNFPILVDPKKAVIEAMIQFSVNLHITLGTDDERSENTKGKENLFCRELYARTSSSLSHST